MQRRTLLKAFALSASVVAMGMSFGAQAADTIKVGIMHSLSGTMAISETPLKDVALMTIDEINAKGVFLLLGIGGAIASLYTDNILVASLLGVFAFSSFWTIKEVFEQEERVKKGWFPKNPKRTYKF